jgi:hypothetical protein
VTRADINRLNAQKSTGPRTPEGKQASSLNALRHGLTSQFAVVAGEDYELYQIHLQAFLDEYEPLSVTELHLTRSLADISWRIDRIASMEANLLRVPSENEEIRDSVTLVKTRDVLMRSVSNLSLHGHRLSRQFAKTRTELLEIQQQNKQETAPGFVFTELAQPPEINGSTDPPPQGAVTSLPGHNICCNARSSSNTRHLLPDELHSTPHPLNWPVALPAS